MKKYAVGIDIGSTCAKTIVIRSDSCELVWRDVRPTGWSSVDTAGSISLILAEGGYASASSDDPGSITNENASFVATGYGRISVPFADKCITEISCHAKGAVKLFGSTDASVIDIGGQDTKLIVIENGAVKEFVMNDKCSAGTGRFLEVMANTLGVSPGGLCEMAEKGNETKISSLCTVFAESEIINLIGRGTPREDIAWAVVDSIVQKVRTQSAKLHLGKGPLCLTGGLCDFPFVTAMLKNTFKKDVLTSPDARFAGAWGAALYAAALE